jgi:hypothetical protein
MDFTLRPIHRKTSRIGIPRGMHQLPYLPGPGGHQREFQIFPLRFLSLWQLSRVKVRSFCRSAALELFCRPWPHATPLPLVF